VRVDFIQLDADLARLADLQPGPQAVALAAQIRRRIVPIDKDEIGVTTDMDKGVW
jgi:hypothetical protein